MKNLSGVGSGERRKGDHWIHTGSTLVSTSPQRMHGHERDATQLVLSGLIPIKVVQKPHATARVWCARRCAIEGSNRSSQ